MTSTDDYPGEMPLLRQVDDATAERLFAGRTVPPELESVATVMRALREVSAQPVRPSATLREQMAAGTFTGTPAYSYRPATGGLLRRVAAAASARATRMRLVTPRRFRLAGLVKVAAVGVAATVLGTATAGFAGTLPAPVQDRFETVVESVTPYQFAEKAGSGPGGSTGDQEGPGSPDGRTDSPGGAPDRPGGTPDQPGESGDACEANRDRGSCGGEVSEDAKDGGVEGPEVSEDARDRDRGRPTQLPTPAQEAPGHQRRPTAPPGRGD